MDDLDFNEYETFVKTFVTNFVASWCASNYRDACIKSNHQLLENPPIEDAKFLANQIWRKMKDFEVY